MIVTVAVERQGQLVLCGGIDTKLTLYNINKVVKKRENAKLMTIVKSY